MANENTAIAAKPTDITTAVVKRVEELVKSGSLLIPKEYPYQNSIREAMFIISDIDINGKSVFDICKPASIQEALFRMVCQGLVPSKEQCFFIPYGDKLTCRRSYFGALAVAKRVADVVDSSPMVIFAGDKFQQEIVNGKIVSITHEQEIGNLDNEIVGAYCFVELKGGGKVIDVMTIKQIRESWKMAKGDGTKNKLQNNFSQKAAERTIMTRALKKLINTSNEANLYDKFDDEEDEIEETTHEVMSSKPSSSAPKVVGLPAAKPPVQAFQPKEQVKQPELVEVPAKKAAESAVQVQQDPTIDPTPTSGEDPANW